MKRFYIILFAVSIFVLAAAGFSCKKDKHSQSALQSITVDAIVDRSIVLPRDTLTVHGTAVSYSGSVVSYHWTEISGPNQVTIANANVASTLLSGFVAGVYDFKFTATDSNGKTAGVRIVLTVYATDPCNGCWDY